MYVKFVTNVDGISRCVWTRRVATRQAAHACCALVRDRLQKPNTWFRCDCRRHLASLLGTKDAIICFSREWWLRWWGARAGGVAQKQTEIKDGERASYEYFKTPVELLEELWNVNPGCHLHHIVPFFQVIGLKTISRSKDRQRERDTEIHTHCQLCLIP